jgi:Protein of unknown function (DUF2778)
MWTFQISTGLVSHDGASVGTGYSGAPGYKDNPADEDLINKGPLPEGWYTMGDPIDSPDTGPYSIPLEPDSSDVMYDRSGFFWHGDSIHDPGDASHGCIVSAYSTRKMVVESGDRRLQVIA